jgi:hypothetical protein
MRRSGLTLRTMLLVIAMVAFLLGWARWRAGPGNPVLVLTQLPVAWVSIGAIGLVLGHALGPTAPGHRLRSTMAGLSALAGLGMLAVFLARERAFTIRSSDGLNLWYPEYWIMDFEYWLNGLSVIPRFWKVNCTHPPAAIVLGMVLTALMGLGGILIGFRVKLSRLR